MLEYALEYARRGWHVFPCQPRLKIPFPKTHGVLEATTDEQTIRAWWQRWPTANIALACGEKSGVYVVDIDVDETKKPPVNGWKSLAEFPELPDTVKQNTPRNGGAHFLFKASVPPKNKNDFRNGIDIRGDGFYILIAPSVHPNGKTYEWAEGIDKTLAEYPDFMRPELEKRPALPWELPKGESSAPRVLATHPQCDIITRAEAYLDECEPAVQGHGGHDKLLWAARCLVSGFSLDENTALSLLWNKFNPKCIPPWNPGVPADVKDFERKVNEANKTPCSKPRGWLLDEYGFNNDSRLLEFGESLRDSLLDGEEKKSRKKKPKPEDQVAQENPPEIQFVVPQIKEWLLKPTGLVGDICRWMNETALKDQPLLSLAASLTFCGALFGRKVKDSWDNRTNIYAMSVAPSSAGKGHARKQIKALIAAAGIDKILAGEDVTSDAAIEKRLEAAPVSLFCMDEIGHMMGTIKSGGGSDPHLSKIVPCLMKLYSAANETYMGKEYASGERRRIEQPCCCLYGTTTPEKLCAGISPAEIEDGWLGRVLVFASETNPKKDYNKAYYREVPQHLITTVQSWYERQVPPPEGKPNIEATVGCWQMELQTTAEAQARFLAFEDECERRAANNSDKGVDKLWGKAGENARRIALIVAAGDRFDNPDITVHHVDYACNLITYLLETLEGMVDSFVASSSTERDKQNILRIIKKFGKNGIGKNKLCRCTQQYSKRLRDDYLKDLQESDMIVVGHQPGKRAQWLWVWPYGLTGGLTGKDKDDE
jgi:hypothetical protein